MQRYLWVEMTARGLPIAPLLLFSSSSSSSAPVEQQLSGAVGRLRDGHEPTGPNWWSLIPGWVGLGGREEALGWLFLDWGVVGYPDAPLLSPQLVHLLLSSPGLVLCWHSYYRVCFSFSPSSCFYLHSCLLTGCRRESETSCCRPSGRSGINVLYLNILQTFWWRLTQWLRDVLRETRVASTGRREWDTPEITIEIKQELTCRLTEKRRKDVVGKQKMGQEEKRVTGEGGGWKKWGAHPKRSRLS